MCGSIFLYCFRITCALSPSTGVEFIFLCCHVTQPTLSLLKKVGMCHNAAYLDTLPYLIEIYVPKFKTT